MKQQEIHKGMLVRLKSGGPSMTVRAISASQAYCEWFTETDRRQGTFDFSSLEVMSSAESPGTRAPDDVS